MNVSSNRVVVVTGSGRGIGAAIAIRLAQSGARVAVNYFKDKDSAFQVLSRIRSTEGDAILVQADVREPDQARRLIDEAVSAFGRLDALINNAHTLFERASILDLSWEQIQEQIDGSLRSSFYCSKYAIPYMKVGKCPAILNISSVTAQLPEMGFAHRNVAKAALEGFTRCLAVETAPLGIRVNALSVGWTETNQLGEFCVDFLDRKKLDIPMKRFASPEEIAEIAFFMLSPVSSYMTSVVLPVTGGLCPNLL
jgi:3-oxoacyl-[acyl-carrier protein] reductase